MKPQGHENLTSRTMLEGQKDETSRIRLEGYKNSPSRTKLSSHENLRGNEYEDTRTFCLVTKDGRVDPRGRDGARKNGVRGRRTERG